MSSASASSSLLVQPLPLAEHRVLQISHTGEELTEPELNGEERHLRVLQQLPLATLLSSSVEEEDEGAEEEEAAPARAAAAAAAASTWRGPTPELMAKLTAAHAEADQAARLVTMLQEQRHLKLQHIMMPPVRAQTDPPEVCCYLKRKQMSATGGALSQGVEALRAQLALDRSVHAEVCRCLVSSPGQRPPGVPYLA